jgi:putative peptide maturation dehydrogenase
MRVKRAHFVLFDLADGQRIDLAALFRGEVDVRPEAPDMHALVLTTGARELLTREELETLMAVPAGRWVDAGDVGADLARSLAERGLLISDTDDDERLAALRARHAAFVDHGWHPYAAGYHFMTRREGMDIREDPENAEWTPVGNPTLRRFVETFGPSPPPFHSPAPDAPRVALPPVERDDGLYRVLTERRTTRSFAVADPMRLEHLALVLRYVFGAHGTGESDLGTHIKRTSPSASARHSIEAYPLLSGVEGVGPGLYHYDARDHALTLLEAMDADEARATAAMFACGQDHFGDAHASFILSSRFDRAFWKYWRGDTGYAAILVEAGHLSQTLYLIATELGLGAYVTLAINSLDIERRMALDGCDEGVVAMLGCGPRSSEPSRLDLSFTGR